MTEHAAYLGKYRGKVVQNLDPESRGRIQVSVPEVLGNSVMSWALPCIPYAGNKAGIYAVPPKDANIWVEFEGGNPDRPVWVGCFWEKSETPKPALEPPAPVQHILLTTPNDNLIHISDAPGDAGGITLSIKSGAKITINDTGITITNGKNATITLQGATVDVNNGALTVT